MERLPSGYRKYLGNDSLMIWGDLMAKVVGDKQLTTYFMKETHNLNLSIIFIIQNLFYKKK